MQRGGDLSEAAWRWGGGPGGHLACRIAEFPAIIEKDEVVVVGAEEPVPEGLLVVYPVDGRRRDSEAVMLPARRTEHPVMHRVAHEVEEVGGHVVVVGADVGAGGRAPVVGVRGELVVHLEDQPVGLGLDDVGAGLDVGGGARGDHAVVRGVLVVEDAVRVHEGVPQRHVQRERCLCERRHLVSRVGGVGARVGVAVCVEASDGDGDDLGLGKPLSHPVDV
mmetsp:Transcript_27274/g.55714  ORF Transcript_27274/g.55714 Transcript_27274/m.55714 type:complete len:221 (+) Transcript_27274:432-1094(+)